ncbi:HEAT repeat domain-containing protein [Cellulomonas sp. URHD0024]|uniref:HEAT repeat domain-containing protein n=1 Tax=Cellulomonas sp. URHD0024 TaxID=1302620 RepID=UPI000404CD60|nr:HEAT repeat domain-containing protein [Cellulomonas sp. URHD0024]
MTTPITVLTWAIVALATAIVLLSAVLVAVRLRRTLRERRQASLRKEPRRQLVELVADPDEEGVDRLLALPRPAWDALEPVAVAMLGKVRGEARDSLTRVFEERGVVESALADLGHRSPERRARAAQALGLLARPEGVEPICGLLKDPEPFVRVVAARALGALASADAAGPLLASLDDGLPAQVVADALGRIGSGALPALHAALLAPQPATRASAVDALALIGSGESVDPISGVLAHDDTLAVRVSAALALGRIGQRAVVDPLLEATGETQPAPLRAAAVRAIGTTGAASAVSVLVVLVGDSDPRVAHEAAQALRRTGPPGVRALEQLVGPEDAANPEHGTGPAHAREALALARLDLARR